MSSSNDYKTVEAAFRAIFPRKEFDYLPEINYSGRFKGYNANARLQDKKLIFNMSKSWRTVDNAIKIGLIQELIVRLFNKKVHTFNMDLYTIFLHKVHIGIPKINIEPMLLQSFVRINEQFFYNTMELPNLIWGRDSINKLGSYDYGTDTVSMSKILKDDLELLDYVMHHELLHKKHKFKSKYGRTHAHTKAFRDDEKKYPNQPLLENRLGRLARQKKFFKFF